MPNPLIKKLQLFADLTIEDEQILEGLAKTVRKFGPREDIIVEGERPEYVHLVLDGWAARYKLLGHGTRAILAFLIPGDLCDLQVSLLDEMDHSLGALSSCTVACIKRPVVAELLDRGDAISRALLISTLVDEAILRQWLVTTAHAPADQRIAHLICEMLLRHRSITPTETDSFILPLTQQEIGDTMGLTDVHVNRMLQSLRSANLIMTEGKLIKIPDLGRLEAFAEFNSNYLHHHRRSAHA